MTEQPATSQAQQVPQPRKGRVIAGAGAVVTIVGAVPTALGALLLVSAAYSDDPNAGWALFVVMGLFGFALPILLVGVVMLLVGRLRARRGDLHAAALDGPGGVVVREKMGASIAGLVFMWLPIVGLPLSIYGFFGNPEGSTARRLGLAGVLGGLVVTLLVLLGY